MGKPSFRDFFCSFCKQTKKVRVRNSRKFCSVECSKNSRLDRIDSQTNKEFDIDDIPESPDTVIKQYVKKNNFLMTKAKNLQTEIKLLQNNIIFSENITKVLQEGIKALPVIRSISPIEKTGNTTHTEESVLLLSDLHAAEVVSNIETDGLAEYSFETFCLRLQKLEDSIVRVTDIQRKGGAKLDTLNIFSLGDLISGEIHLELLRTNDFPLITSALQVSVVLSQFVAKLSTIYKNINFYGVDGNHDRLTPEKTHKTRYNNIARIIYETIALLTKDYKNIKYTIPKSPYMVCTIFNHKYLITHGDLKISGSIYNGMDRLGKQFQDLYRSRGGFDIMCVGHLHTPLSIEGVLMNGSLIGTNEYAINVVRKNTTPSQKFFGVSKNNVTTWQYDLFVKDTPDKHSYIYNEDYLAVDLMKEWELS